VLWNLATGAISVEIYTLGKCGLRAHLPRLSRQLTAENSHSAPVLKEIADALHKFRSPACGRAALDWFQRR